MENSAPIAGKAILIDDPKGVKNEVIVAWLKYHFI
jgi:hypothetical protein